MSEMDKPVISCTCVGVKMKPAGQTWIGEVISQKYVEDIGMLLLTFKNKFVCNATTCRVVIEKDTVKEKKLE